ncbi:MAG: sigma-70 family RNA polymerase sigma factor [Polyangiaceae bacterium]
MDDAQRRFIAAALEEHEKPLLRYATSLVGREAACDLVQDVFLQLCRASREEIGGHVRPWLFVVCRNRAISQKRRRVPESDVEEADVETGVDSGPLARLEKKEAATLLMRALDGLSERDREVVVLKFASGLSYKEIAEVTKLTVNHVGVILHEALKKVRTTVGQLEGSRRAS